MVCGDRAAAAAGAGAGAPRARRALTARGAGRRVTLKAKTTCKRTRAVQKCNVKFRASRAGTTIGSGADCDVCIMDASLNAEHSRVYLRADSEVVFESVGRTYFLIGGGSGGSASALHVMEPDQVVKMGACSLQVTHTVGCLTPSEQAAAAHAARLASERGDGSSGCYICFEDGSEPGNALIPSPCICAKLVHRACLVKWISVKGTRVCSICKSKLPIDIAAEPPYIVLQVVRHMRGLHWTGDREYIIGFAARRDAAIVVGSDPECDLCLPDPSLSRKHARIAFQDGKFYVQDTNSSAGTFMKLSSPLRVPAGDTAQQFKLGRTMLSVKVKHKRSVLRWRRGKG